MGKRTRQSEYWRDLVDAGLAAGLKRYQEYRANKPGKPTARELVMVQRQALISDYERRVSSFERRKQRLRSSQIVWTGGAAGAGVIGMVDMVAGSPSPGWFVASAFAGVFAYLNKDKRANLQPPQMPALPPLPIEPLPAGTPGADEIDRWSRAAQRWDEMLPLVDELHPQAGEELRRSLQEVDPALRSLVERLGTLHRTAEHMPGTQAAAAAQRASIEVTARLRDGVEAYEGLVAAAAELIAAPELNRSVTEVVRPAILDVQAYTAGLRQAAGIFTQP